MIVVCPLGKLDLVVSEHQPSHIISLLGAQSDMPDFSDYADLHHLKLNFNDIAEPREGLVPPGQSHIKDLLAFAEDWNRQRPLIIHCWAGISRSTAASYIIQCVLQPDRDELQLARFLRAASPSATPNPRMITLGDEFLNRNGRMQAAIASIGRGAEAWEGNVFNLPVPPPSDHEPCA